MIAANCALSLDALGVIIAMNYYGGEMRAVGAQGGPGAAQLFGLGAAILVPSMVFIVLAHMVARAQELRTISRSMTEVALRLAEPETIASDAIVSVGQAIRREVAAMGDGVERALARAAELESLVHNEVAALERAYNETSCASAADRGPREPTRLPRRPVPTRSQRHQRRPTRGEPIHHSGERAGVSSVNDAAQRITRRFAEKGEHIHPRAGSCRRLHDRRHGDRGGELMEQLNRTSDEVSRTLACATHAWLLRDFKTDELTDKIVDISGDLSPPRFRRGSMHCRRPA